VRFRASSSLIFVPYLKPYLLQSGIDFSAFFALVPEQDARYFVPQLVIHQALEQ
jgi:hypothetical protein